MSKAATATNEEFTGEPLTARNRIPEQAWPILDAEDDLFEQKWHATTANMQADDRQRIKIAEAGGRLRALQDAPKASAAQVKAAEAAVERETKKLAEQQARRHAADALKPGSKKHLLDEFMASSVIHRRLVWVGTTDTAIEGKDARGMCDHYAAKFRSLHADRKRVIAAPMTRQEIADGIREDLDRAAANIAASACAATRMNLIPGRSGDRWERRAFKIPQNTIPDGLGRIIYTGDGLGLMLSVPAMFEMVAEGVTKLALEGHDESKALDFITRADKIYELDSAIEQTERLHEFWVRKGREAGINTGGRISNNALCVLDLRVA